MRDLKKQLWIYLSVLLLIGTAAADLSGRIRGVIQRKGVENVEWGVHVVRAADGATMFSWQADKAMLPASNMKLVVTAAGLHYLGADYEYVTKVGFCGNALVVKGSGDPLLGDTRTDEKYGRQPGWVFSHITKEIKHTGVGKISDVIVDASVFDDERVHPSWPKEQLNQWYACEVCGFNYNTNCIELTVTNKNGQIRLDMVPQTDYIQLSNKVRAVSSGKSAVGAYRTLTPNSLVVRGRCKSQEGPFDVAIERPAAFFGYILAERMQKAGIETTGHLIVGSIPSDCSMDVLTVFRTPLKDVLHRSNKYSLGLAAESLLKTIAAENNGGVQGSWRRGQELIGVYLKGIGVREGQYRISDGSGLSRENRLSPSVLTRVIYDMHSRSTWPIYRDSLAVGGVDGTIYRYFKDAKYRRKVIGKTGYIAGVKSFSGVCMTDSGDYIFSILANSANGRTRGAINDIAEAIIDEYRAVD